jgi:hypothetical protein
MAIKTENARPDGYARRPGEGPEVPRPEINRRQADKLNALEDGKIGDPYLTPEASRTGLVKRPS